MPLRFCCRHLTAHDVAEINAEVRTVLVEFAQKCEVGIDYSFKLALATQIGFELRKHAEHVELAERVLAVRTIVPRGNL